MLERLAWIIVGRRRLVLLLTAAFVAVAAFAIRDLGDHMSHELYVLRGSESHDAETILADEFGVRTPNLAVLVEADAGDVDTEEARSDGLALVALLEADPEVSDVLSYWTAPEGAPLRAEDGSAALVVARIEGDDQAVEHWLQEFDASPPSFEHVEVRVGGLAETLREGLVIAESARVKAELVTGPLLLIALLVVFGSLVAASLPLLAAVLATIGTMAIVRLLTLVTDMSEWSLFLVTALAIGFAVDYSLFVVSRFREELAAGWAPDLAAVRTVRTAGRTVLFSAGAVMSASIPPLLFPLTFMRSFGLAGLAVSAASALSAVVVLPAILAILGPRVDRGTVWRRSFRAPSVDGRWHRTAVVVMKRPLLVSGLVLGTLLVVALPALRMNLGLPDASEVPASSDARQVNEAIAGSFDARASTPLLVVVDGGGEPPSTASVAEYAAQLAALDHVVRVDSVAGTSVGGEVTPLPAAAAASFRSGDRTYLRVSNTAEPALPDAEALVREVRAVPNDFAEVLVTGEAASFVDVKDATVSRVPLALALVSITTFVVLFLQFGSILVPLKAILLNFVTLAALFGLLVVVFQEGALKGVLHFDVSGTTYIFIPITIFCLAFGLSMDYEVFLLSRIKEEYDRTGDNDAAVAMGLERSGRIVTAAAVLIALVFISMALLGELRMMKMLGLGLGTVVLLDAFVVRGTVVPALMKLAGGANWWAPRPLRWLHGHIGISEHVDLDEPGAAPVPPTPRDPALAGRDR